ncbi:DlpA domain-containing protein [Dothidotthia symphoricarpi CBS 119687]|uniref:DlpA domain-containing protein n=1 Tax=Dothidotthia symphoricarpi CBS 119687 TaxID=1392245 RepID=A0A6A6AHH7_9PLEO|nr:DlpA domain-containing protein [Dothidotthia symphoricarpi CBS 119687]KAF2130347.1 DlpA domain-containing protein [Dothidotthia symphoricarpi CBS 119687]
MATMASPRWKELSKYAACDLADGLLKLNVPGVGFLADIRPMPHTANIPHLTPRKIVAPASTFLMLPKATKSFPNPAPTSENVPASNLPDSRPYADYTESGTIVVISQPVGQSCAVVGGIMAARMKYLGAEGLVVDGRVRDLVALNETQLPIWSKATSIIGAGAETKFHARNVPVKIGGSTVAPGDIVMIDPFENGVVAVPQDKVEELLELLPKLVGADEKVIADVEQGVSVQEAFKHHRN